MGDTHRKPAADTGTEVSQKAVELLRAGHHGQDTAHVLRGLPPFLRKPGEGVAADTGYHRRPATRAGAEF